MRCASPYSYAVLERLLQQHFPFPRRLLQLHALFLTSGALLPDPKCSAATVTAFPYNCLAHAHLRAPAASTSSSPPSAPLRLFSAMLARGARPNRHTFPSLLRSAASSGSVALALHAQCLRRGLAADRFVACSLVSAYARSGNPARDARKVFVDMEGSPDLDALCLAGDLTAAESLFERMAVRDAVSWTTLISGLSRGGRHRCAVESFGEFLLEHKGRLGEATLVRVLSACATLMALTGFLLGRRSIRTSSAMILTLQRSWARRWLTCTGSLAAVTVLSRLSTRRRLVHGTPCCRHWQISGRRLKL